MRTTYTWVIGALLFASVGAASCVDDIKFGNAFLDKAPGGTATKDTVFSSALYTQQFLNAIYGRQYYGLPYKDDTSLPVSSSAYVGKAEALSDCWQLHWAAPTIYSQYYTGIHKANYVRREDKFCWNDEKVWEVTRWCWLLIENIDKVPDLSASEKARMVAEAKCLIATRYFDMFRHYGGLPILRSSFIGNESSYSNPRATVEETVNFMIEMLDDAINSGALPWAYDGSTAATSPTYTGRWTKAGAMALKCKIWQFAASPLFNDAQGYAGGSSEAEQKHLVWYGGYRKELWDNCLKACEDFMSALRQDGFYELKQSVNNTPAGYRWAYRMAYIAQDSREILHSVRTNGYDAFKSATYMWHYWADLGRNSYTPTQEYVEMFPWANGKPFDWDKTKAEGRLDAMFMTGTLEGGDLTLTRDPRLYESARVNGLPKMLDWSTPAGVMGGQPYELWVGGYDAGNNSKNETGQYATGYDNMKYYLGNDYLRQYTQWVTLRLSDIYLTYAEALLQARNDNAGALEYINKVRARVGLGKLEDCNPDKNLRSNKANLLQELLRERACELGLEDSRFFDLIRYKRKDLFEKELHGLLIYRLDENGNRIYTKWFEGDQNKGAKQPTRFDYEKFVLKNIRRYWWDNGFDAKWYLSPIPEIEINKKYGLVQNPGW